MTLAVYVSPPRTMTWLSITRSTWESTRYLAPFSLANSTNASSCVTRFKTNPSKSNFSGLPDGGTICISVERLEIASSGVRNNSSISGTFGQRRRISSLLGTNSPHCKGVPIGSRPSMTRTSAPFAAAYRATVLPAGPPPITITS